MQRELGSAHRSGNLRIEIATDNSAERDHKHDPEGHAGNAAEFERGMKGDDDRRGDAGNNMEVHPVPGATPTPKPRNHLAQRVEENDEKQDCSKHAKLEADGAAGPEQCVLVGVRPLLNREKIVAGAIDSQADQKTERSYPSYK